MNPTPKILLISYYFPPSISGGVGRPYSLYRYLPGVKLNPIVITNSCYGHLKVEKNIYRFDALVNWPKAGKVGKKFLMLNGRSLLNKMALPEYRDYYWQRNILKEIDKILDAHKISLIYATYPSIDALQIAYNISHKYEIPLISEFRDGLLHEPVTNPNKITLPQLKRFEKKIVTSSKSIITIGKNLSNHFESRYPKIPVHTVYNGYDAEDFEELQSIEISDHKKTNVFHFGSFGLSRKRDVKPLFTAISKLKHDGIISSNNFHLYLVGKYTLKEKRLSKLFSLNDVISFHPPMMKQEGFRWMFREADYLLFYGVEGDRSVISAKLLEYLKFDIPIIGICKGNEAENIITITNTGIVSAFDTNSIYSLFLKCMNNKVPFKPKRREISKFDRKKQAQQIAQIIKSFI